MLYLLYFSNLKMSIGGFLCARGEGKLSAFVMRPIGGQVAAIFVAVFERHPDFYITVSVYRAVDCRSTCVWILNSRSLGARWGEGMFAPITNIR